MKNGRLCGQIIGGNKKQVFLMKQSVLIHDHVHLLLSKGHACYRPWRTGERKHISSQGFHGDAILSVLNLATVKKGRRTFLDSSILLCLIAWGPKELAESTNFSVSLKKMMSDSMLWGCPKQKSPRFSILLLHLSTNENDGIMLCKNRVLRKIRKKLQSMLNFWPEEW